MQTPPTPKVLPSTPNAKQFSQPLVHFHSNHFFELRDRLNRESKVWFLLKTLLKKIMLDERVHSVTFSKRIGPGGKHAFLSFAPHFHPEQKQVNAYLKKYPNATEEEWCDQVEWYRTDGFRNDDQGGATQGIELNEVCTKVFLLALGYHFAAKFESKDFEKYTSKAHHLLKVFFDDQETAMDPEVIYGQYIRGCQEKSTNRPEGLLHVRSLIMISQVLPLLPPPPSAFSPHLFMHAWLERHASFLQHHEVGIKGAARRNNISSHYFALLTTHLVALNRALEAHSIITSLFFPTPPNRHGIYSKIDESGVLTAEVTRPNPFHYTAFELEALVYLADLATSVKKYEPSGNRLVDVWEAEMHALRRAVHFGLEYFLRSVPPKSSRHLPPSVPKEIESGSDIRSLLFVTRSVAVRYGREPYEWIVGKGGAGEMEPIKGRVFVPSVPFTGWTVSARLRWALLEGY